MVGRKFLFLGAQKYALQVVGIFFFNLPMRPLLEGFLEKSLMVLVGFDCCFNFQRPPKNTLVGSTQIVNVPD